MASRRKKERRIVLGVKDNAASKWREALQPSPTLYEVRENRGVDAEINIKDSPVRILADLRNLTQVNPTFSSSGKETVYKLCLVLTVLNPRDFIPKAQLIVIMIL